MEEIHKGSINARMDIPEEGVRDENCPYPEEKKLLKDLVYESTLRGEERELMLDEIENCKDYETYQRLQYELEAIQTPYDHIPNPSATDLKKHVKKIARG